MDNKPAVAVLFSSDSTPQYEKDIFNVIALPTNGEYRFRYKKEYIDLTLQNRIKNVFTKGARVLIAFRTNSIDTERHIDPFMVPIRWAEIKEIEEIEKIVIFKFIAKEYPIFNSDFENACSTYDQNIDFSKDFFNSNNKEKYFVTDGIPNAVLLETSEDNKNQEKAWIRIIEALSKYNNEQEGKGFFDKFFFKTIVDISDSTMRVEMKDGKSNVIKIVQYNSNDHSTKEAKVDIQYDPSILVSTYGDKDTIECRYDVLDYTFIPQNVSQELDSQVTFVFASEECKSSNEKSNTRQQTTRIRVPIKIKPSIKKKTVINILFSFLGALLIGLNGVFDLFKVEIPTWLGILFFVVGSVILALAGLFYKGD